MPAVHQSKSLLPPSPSGLAGPSLGPAMNPSIDIESPVTTLPTSLSNLVLSFVVTGGTVRFVTARQCGSRQGVRHPSLDRGRAGTSGAMIPQGR